MEIKAKNGQRFLVAKVQAKKEAEGKAAGRKMVVKLLFAAFNSETKKEELQTEWVAFWNGDKPSQPQLYTRISAVPLGEWIVVKLLPKKEGQDASALDFITREGGHVETTNIDEGNSINIFVGTVHPSSGVKTANGKTVYNANLKVNDVWRQISFWASEKQPALPDMVSKICEGNVPVIFVAGKATAYKDSFTYTGFKAERFKASSESTPTREPETADPANAVPIPDVIPDEPEPAVMISIGIYAANPRALTDFTSADDKGWLATVVRYYKPISESEQAQMNAITAYLK